MVELLLNWVLSALVIIVAAHFLHTGVHVANFMTALWTALVLGIINAVLKPILVLLTLPINILTLGIFTFVINAILILLVSKLVPGFYVANFWWAFLFSLVLSIIHWIINAFIKK